MPPKFKRSDTNLKEKKELAPFMNAKEGELLQPTTPKFV